MSVILPAAGASTRFGGDKLARDLGGRPLLVRTVEALSRRAEVRQIIVAGPPDSFETFAARFGPVLGFHGAELVQGGREDRWQSVSLALAHVSPDATHVAVHDAARPCLSDGLLDRVFEAAASLEAVVPCVEVTSTVKEIDPAAAADVAEGDALVDSILGGETAPVLEAAPVVRTVPRDTLRLAQTPQVFARDVLVSAYARGGEGTTDDASVVQQSGRVVHAVPGDPLNIKVTRPDDLRLAAAILRDMASV
ncbi:MAG: 2-C-methyl-D-erythritol 4-phosphate cytidylyltransferase [Phycisphaerales bacterium]|nr:2-C-methyl-D-erythritol 4-phosphate cytidylyltransferase [Phycisphaerales bacterium]